MSVESWKKEFYPVPADKCPPGELISHSLRKWRGYRHDNMRKHGLDPSFKHNHNYDSENPNTSPGYDSLDAGTSSTCSLCVQYQHRDGGTEPCVHCPLYKIRNGQCCYEGKDSPYNVFMYEKDNNPEPMIRLLEEALRQSLPAVTPVVGGVYRTRKGHEIRIDRIEPDAVPDSRVIGTHQIDIAGYRSGWAHACCLDGYYYDGSDPTDRPNDKDLVEVVSLPDPLRTPEAFAASKPPSTQGQNVSTHSIEITRDHAKKDRSHWIRMADMPVGMYGIIRDNPGSRMLHGHLVVSVWSERGYRVININQPSCTWSDTTREASLNSILVEPVTTKVPSFLRIKPPAFCLSETTVGKFFVARNGDIYYHRSFDVSEPADDQRSTLTLFHGKGVPGSPAIGHAINVYDDGCYNWRSSSGISSESSLDIIRPLQPSDLEEIQNSLVDGYYIIQARFGNSCKKYVVEYRKETKGFYAMNTTGVSSYAVMTLDTDSGKLVFPYCDYITSWNVEGTLKDLHNYLPVFLGGEDAVLFLNSKILRMLESDFIQDEDFVLHPCNEYGERLNDDDDEEELDEDDDLEDDEDEDDDE